MAKVELSAQLAEMAQHRQVNDLKQYKCNGYHTPDNLTFQTNPD